VYFGSARTAHYLKALLACICELYWSFIMADDKLYSSQYIGSGTFIISKPKRKAAKRRQSKLKGTVRGARK
jgi:hypothetical protein